MADTEHRDITDPNIHEPKGITSASQHSVYKATGSGSGVWDLLTSDSLDMSEIQGVLEANALSGGFSLPTLVYFVGSLANVSSASSFIFPVPDNVNILRGHFTLGGAITGSAAQLAVRNTVGSNMGGVVNIPVAGSGKGASASFTATSNNILTGPTWFEVATLATSTGAVPVYFTLVGILR